MAEESSVTFSALDSTSPNSTPNRQARQPIESAAPLERWQDRLQHAPQTLRVHIMGIGGAGMGPIARVLLEMGVQVSGSDRQASKGTRTLAQLGARIFETQVAENIDRLQQTGLPHLLVISSAVPPENPERAAAAAAGIQVIKRSEFLRTLLSQRATIAVSGTHGKTTTTGMIAHILRRCGLEPGYIIGAEVPELGSAAAGKTLGSDTGQNSPARLPWFVIEADEYDRMFWGLYPQIAVVTNIEWDHPDCYPTDEEFFNAFRHFLGQVQPGGHIIGCGDDAGVQMLHREIQADPPATSPTWLRYGTAPDNSLHARPVAAESGDDVSGREVLEGENPETENPEAVDCFVGDEWVGRLALQVPGMHNVRNALAAISAAHLCGVPYADALAAVASYRGSSRRFEIIGTARGVTVVDDYGHHPTEVRATLAAARSRYPNRRIVAIFQPHTFSRTRLLCDEMAASFEDADRVLITDIFASREKDDGSVHAREIVARSRHPQIRYTGTLDATTQTLINGVRPGDVVITLSAGDGNRVGHDLYAHLAQHNLPAQTANRHNGTHSTASNALPPLPPGFDIQIQTQISLAPYTSIRVGGPAQWFATVNHPHQLLKLVRWACAAELPYYLLGGGSNVLIADDGIRGLVIYNRCRQVRIDEAPCCDHPQDDRPYVFAESGAAMAGVARRAVRAGLTGLEWAVSVPGTVGGAVVGNAGAHGGEVKDNLAYAQVFWPGSSGDRQSTAGEVRELSVDDFGYAYRHSAIKAGGIVQPGFGPVVLGANFRLPHGEPQEIEARADSYLAHRRRTQPVEPSLGSTFMNPPGDYAGRLIEAAGLKGFRLGGLVISPLHANFIINPQGVGAATAEDVMRLIDHIRATVQTAFGVELIPEVQRVGEWANFLR